MTDPSPQRTSDVNGQLWRARARDWAEVQEGQFAAGYDDVLERAGVGPGMRLLDVGCGAGKAAQRAAALGARVAGIDAAPLLLEIARERVPAGDFRVSDLEDLPFAAASFDVVTGFNAFQFAGNPVRVLAEARLVTPPGSGGRDDLGPPRGDGGGFDRRSPAPASARVAPRCPGPFPAVRPRPAKRLCRRGRADPPPRWSRGTRIGPTLTLPPAYGG